MYDAAELLRVIEPRLAELGMSQADLGAAAFGTRDNSAVQGMKKGSVPSIDRVAAIARALDFEIYFGPRRPRDHGFNEPGGNGAPTILAPPTGYATFVWEHGDLRGIPPVAFSQAWINRHGLDIDRHTCVWVGAAPADSAAPDALALIDRMAPQTGGPTLWALQDRGRSVELARLQFDGKTIVALPHTPDAPARFIRPGGGTVLLGRVLWHGAVE
jgi:hypothetical protein